MKLSMKCSIAMILFAVACLPVAFASIAPKKSLDIYFIDVEGGQATLMVTPQGQTLLIDTGFAGNDARDAKRIVAAAHDAGVKQIDYLLITHFHADHDGGVPELSRLMPISTFIDHGSIASEAERNAANAIGPYNAYVTVRDAGIHIEPKPGDRLPIKGIDAIVVSSAGLTISKPLAGATGKNSACGAAPAPQEFNENHRSTGIRVTYGKFRFLDVGDLTGQPFFSLVCPNDLIGAVDAYLVAHHGNADAAEPAAFAAFKPRVAIMNNGATKGGALVTYALLHQVKGLEDVWQLHRSNAADKENFADDHIANLDEVTGHWLKLSANSDGSFKMTNGRTNTEKSYRARSGL